MTMPKEDLSTAPSAERTRERIGLSVEEAAELLGISRAFAYELVADGTLPSLRLHRRILVPRAALLRMLDVDSSDSDDCHSDPAASGA
jgi:excisionase family DNA binding protein